MIFLTGATGFVGHHLARHLSEAGFPVRALIRDEKKKARLRLPRLETATGDILRLETLRQSTKGCDTVIHLVGVIRETKSMSFHQAHVVATANVLKAAKDNGVRRFIHMSALGARADAPSQYHRTKWQAEELVRASGLNWTIFEPSLIYGPQSEFMDSMLKLLRKPLMPIVAPGMNTGRLQPIHVDDLCACMTKAAQDHAGTTFGQTYKCGGPNHATTEDVLDILALITKKKPRKLFLPYPLARAMVGLGEKIGLPIPATSEQLLMLQEDNICDISAMQRAFGIAPREFEEGLRQTLRVS